MIDNPLRKIFPFLRKLDSWGLWSVHKTKIKFLVVGGWNTLFGFLAFVALYKVFRKLFSIDYFAYTSAQILGTFLAVINAYIGHKYFTFKSNVKGRKMVFEFLRFSLTYGLTFLISLILMPLLVEVIKIKPIIAGIFINLIVITASYIAHSRFSFKLPSREPSAD